MRKPSLSVDTFVAALAVLGAAASTGCSKADHASVAPEPAPALAPGAPKSEGAPAAAAPSPPAAAASAAATGGPSDPAAQNAASDEMKPPPATAAPARARALSPVSATALDGGVKSAAESVEKKKAGMSCGAGSCSADMKKGTGN